MEGNSQSVILIGIGIVGLAFAYKQTQQKALVTTTPNGNVSVVFDYGNSNNVSDTSSSIISNIDQVVPVGSAAAQTGGGNGSGSIAGVAVSPILSVVNSLFGTGGIFGKSAPKAPNATNKTAQSQRDAAKISSAVDYNKSQYYGPVSGLADFLAFLDTARKPVLPERVPR